MTKAIRIYKTGSSAEMKWEDVNVAAPGVGQVAIKQTAVGLNFLDVYQRSGMYAGDSFPVTLGNEGAGVVTAVGVGVSEFAIGDRVAYGSGGGMKSAPSTSPTWSKFQKTSTTILLLR